MRRSEAGKGKENTRAKACNIAYEPTTSVVSSICKRETRSAEGKWVCTQPGQGQQQCWQAYCHIKAKQGAGVRARVGEHLRGLLVQRGGRIRNVKNVYAALDGVVLVPVTRRTNGQ